MHSKGYCHRDIKPWNIMVSSDLSSLKIIDFGYATPVNYETLIHDSSVPECLRHYMSGTESYMAPELFEKDISMSLDKSDVFALGCLLFNMCTG
jgi:serine/threonine protein kinase